MIRGFTLGKFAPLHKGHQYLIDFALQQVDELTVVVYACEELPSCSLQTRIDWINQLYPSLQVIAAPNGPKEVGYSKEITQKHDAYLMKLLKGQKFDSFFSSEPYGEHVSRAFKCKDIRVDQARTDVPISATKIRTNIYMYAEYLSPLVFDSLVKLGK
jgi:cytidyltransferase-like protein